MIASFLTVGQQVLILFALMAVGFALGKTGRMDDKSSLTLTNLVIYAVSPAMMVVAFQREKDTADLHNFFVCMLLAVVVHVVSIALAYLFLRGKDHACGAMRFGAVFSNCGFMGYPLMAAMLGSIGIFYGSAYVIVFTVLTWTWGVYAVTGDRSQLRLKPLLLNPGVISVAAAMALYLCRITVPEMLMVPVRYLSELNTPVPMLVVGYQLSHADFRRALRGASAWVTLVLRLVVLPLVSLGVCLALRVPHDLTLVLLIAASAPPAALLSMFAARFGKDTELASSLVSVQTAISAVTMPVMVGLAELLA